MDACAFDSFRSQMSQLSTRQCAHVLAVLKTGVDRDKVAAILEAASSTRNRYSA